MKHLQRSFKGYAFTHAVNLPPKDLPKWSPLSSIIMFFCICWVRQCAMVSTKQRQIIASSLPSLYTCLAPKLCPHLICPILQTAQVYMLSFPSTRSCSPLGHQDLHIRNLMSKSFSFIIVNVIFSLIPWNLLHVHAMYFHIQPHSPAQPLLVAPPSTPPHPLSNLVLNLSFFLVTPSPFPHFSSFLVAFNKEVYLGWGNSSGGKDY